MGIAAALGAEYGFIGSGQNNCIDTGAAMSTATPFGVIGGGQNNTICAGATHSAIVGGQNNCALGQCSVILGGSNNNDGGFPHTAVFGNGISATLVPGPSSFWVDELVVPNIPIGFLTGIVPTPPVGYPTGSLWYYPDVNGNNVVYVV